MTFIWSPHAEHVQSLFKPWCRGDGYTEVIIQQKEAQFGIRFPPILRDFYRAWGNRNDLTGDGRATYLFGFNHLFMTRNYLIIGATHQTTFYFAISITDRDPDDPPVYFAVNDDVPHSWNLSHNHVSAFLDEVAYQNALSGTALHGGVSERQPRDLEASIAQHWRKLEVDAPVWGLVPGIAMPRWAVYVGDGQVLAGHQQIWAAARSLDDLAEIARVLSLRWETWW